MRDSGENKYLDCPLPDKTLVSAISRQFGLDMAKHIMMKGVETVEGFAKILNEWDAMEEDNNSGNTGRRREEERMEIDGAMKEIGEKL